MKGRNMLYSCIKTDIQTGKLLKNSVCLPEMWTKLLKENEREEKEAGEREVIEKEEKEKERLFSSKRSEALKLYKKGTTSIDVSIELEISAEEAKTFYTEYCSLQYPFQLLPL